MPGHPLDSDRSLTADGKIEAAQMAKWLKDDIGRVDIVISSMFVRAKETAEIMADALGSYVVSTSMLNEVADPDAPLDSQAIWAEIQRLAQQSEEVLIVSHHGVLRQFVPWLMSGGVIRFEWGAIAHLKASTSVLEAFPRVQGTLHWFVTPKLVEKELGEQEVAEAARNLLQTLSS